MVIYGFAAIFCGGTGTGSQPTGSKRKTERYNRMKSKNHVLQAFKLALAALPLLALQTATAEDKTPQGDHAVMCAKCKTVWVNTPVTSAGSKAVIATYRQEKSMKCADCESAVATFFKTGKLAHECKACGSELVHCKARQ